MLKPGLAYGLRAVASAMLDPWCEYLKKKEKEEDRALDEDWSRPFAMIPTACPLAGHAQGSHPENGVVGAVCTHRHRGPKVLVTKTCAWCTWRGGRVPRSRLCGAESVERVGLLGADEGID